MSDTGSSAHRDFDALVDYWLGDTDAAQTEAIDAHLLACDACGATLDQVMSLARGVKAAFHRGAVPSVLSAPFVERLKAAGRRVREYRVPRDGSVACSVAPQDDMLVAHLAAPLQGVTRLDAVFAFSYIPGHEERLSDIPFDPAGGEVLFTPKMTEVRQHPAHQLVVRLLSVDASGERELGRYTFQHQAMP
jgi:anti-sigma factor RsiW